MTDEQKQAIISSYINDTYKREEAPIATIGPLGNIRYNFGRIGRELFVVEPLPQGAMPIYDRDVDIAETVVGEEPVVDVAPEDPA